MGSSYYVTYGGNRLTFGGTPGPVAWEYAPSYSETLLWSGNWYSGSIQLSDFPSAYDAVRVVPGGDNDGANSQLYNPLEVSWRQLSSTNAVVYENAMFGTTATSGANTIWWFGGQLSGCSGKNWSYSYAYGRRVNNTGHTTRYDFAQIRQIWGIKYG